VTRSPAPVTTRNKWSRLLWMIPVAVAALVLVVLAAQWARELTPVRAFLEQYPGQSELPADAPIGFPAWLAWQHFLSSFLLLLIIRTGWAVRTNKRPPAHWTRNNSGLLRTKNPPTRITLDLWLHLSLDVLWVLNGILFYVLIFATGQWLRLVPIHWDVFPNALSAALQYASLRWPTEDGWVNYNSLQLLAYFTVVFIAAPLAIVSGLRMSGAWPRGATRVNAIYPMKLARAVHLPVMIFFVGFIVVHVTLVLATGALRNLNHMYAVRSDDSWVGFWIFVASLVVMVVAWVGLRPVVLRPIAALTGSVTRR